MPRNPMRIKPIYLSLTVTYNRALNFTLKGNIVPTTPSERVAKNRAKHKQLGQKQITLWIPDLPAARQAMQACAKAQFVALGLGGTRKEFRKAGLGIRVRYTVALAARPGLVRLANALCAKVGLKSNQLPRVYKKDDDFIDFSIIVPNNATDRRDYWESVKAAKQHYG